MKNHICRIGVVGILTILCLASVAAAQTPLPCCAFDPFYWSVSGTVTDPIDDTATWVFSTPEAEGMDGVMLAVAIEDISRLPSLHSLLILRHGRIVSETYFNGQTPSRSYEIASVAKSIMSALAGIAIDLGLIESVSQRIEAFFPDTLESDVASKRRITIRDLLTMQAGLVWEPIVPLDLVAWQHVVDDVLALPVTFEPRTLFNYSTGLVHLFSAILTEVSGETTCEFACEHLFTPLGIAPEFWGSDADGIYTGGWFMYFTPRELARFGQLYLQGGEWNGTQIIPAAWVASSLSTQVSFDPFSGYGYWWWLSSYWDAATNITYEIQSARGGGGQAIFLIPDLDLVMVTTSDHAYQGTSVKFDSEAFLQDVLIPSVLDTP